MSDTPKTEAEFANMLNEAFGRGSIHAEMENSDYLSHHLKADEKMAAYREWRDAKARELAAVTAERDAAMADARRYRWLDSKFSAMSTDIQLRGATLDAAIDAAMAGERG